MLDPISIIRLYTRPKSLTPSMLVGLAPNSIVVEPILPPRQSEGGIQLQQGDIPGTAAIAYRVLQVGPASYEWPVNVGVGDVVIVRNAMLEPLHPAQDILVIEAKHVLARMLLPEVPGDA